MKLIKLPIVYLLSAFVMFFAGNASAQCPNVVLNPTNQTVCAGTNSTFVAFPSTTTGVFYQWQVNDGSGWVNCTAAPYTGFTTTNLTIVGSPAPFTGYQYRCRMDKASCPTVTSQAATLTVNTPPFVNVSPEDSVMCEGGVASFEVDAIGGGLTYQWQVKAGINWVPLVNNSTYSNVSTSKLIVTNPALSLNGSFFRVRVSGNCNPPENSDSAKLTINIAPQIATQPTGTGACLGTDVHFAASATGTNLTYQWQENQGAGWVDLPGALPYGGVYTNQLDIYAITAPMNGRQYRLVVKGACNPPDTTNPITLIAQSAPAVSSITDINTVCEGDNTSVQVIATGSNLTYQWQEDAGTGFTNLSDIGIYSGTTTDKLLINGVPAANNNRSYRCLIVGVCPPAVFSDFKTMSVIQDKSVFTDPRDTAIPVGETTYFKIKSVGSNTSHQWQVDDGGGFQNISANHPNYLGVTTDKLYIINAPITLAGYKYRCLVYGGCNPEPKASIGATLGLWWPTSVSNTANADNAFTIYPNPVSGNELTIMVSNPASKSLNAKIVDQFGRILATENIDLNTSKSHKLNISALPSGVYSVLLSDNQFNITKAMKFTKL